MTSIKPNRKLKEKLGDKVFYGMYAISDADFRNSLRVPRGGAGLSHLKRAMELFERNRAKQAWLALAEYHREALADEIKELRGEAERVLGSVVLYKDTLAYLKRQRVKWSCNMVDDGVGFDDDIDWQSANGTGVNTILGWLRPVAFGYAVTGDRRILEFMKKTLRSFYPNKNLIKGCGAIGPHGITCPMNGILNGWDHSTTIATVYMAILASGGIEADIVEICLKLLLGVHRALMYSWRWHKEGNGVSVAASALFRTAKRFPEFREAAAWRKSAAYRFLYILKNDFLNGEGYYERTWGYGYMSLEGIISAYNLAKKHGGFGAKDKEIRELIRKSLQWFAKTLGPEEMSPRYGDCWLPPYFKDGFILDLSPRMFPAEDRYLGVDRGASYFLERSGFAVMRNGEAKDSSYAIINFGKYAGWHSHQDLLSMDFWSHGKQLIAEVGRKAYGYYPNPLHAVLYAPECHNLFLIDGMTYDCRREGALDVHWHSTDAADFFTATHRAYGFYVWDNKGPGSFNIDGIVRRTIVFVKDPGYALVVDSVKDENRADAIPAVSQLWHSPFPFRQVGPNLARTLGKTACLLAFERPESLRKIDCTRHITGYRIHPTDPKPDHYSLRASRMPNMGERGVPGFATVLYPFAGKMPKVSIRALPTENGLPYRAEGYEITTPRGTDRILLNPEGLSGVRCARRNLDVRAHIMLGGGRGTVRCG